MTIEGVLPVMKPQGWTSHDVVAKVRRLVGEKRIGHTGTLDPQAMGVLPLCLGRATRIVEYIQDLPKTYRATLRIGLATDTEDLSGQVIRSVDAVAVSERDIRDALASFVGEIEQIPPMYSAVKVQGKKLYELARQGKEVERKPRRVTVYRLTVEEMRLDLPHPEVVFTVRCSKGTYIRTLCVDIGRALGYPAVMAELVRTETGAIGLAQCLTLAQIKEAHENGSLARHVIPADQALGHLPACHVPPRQAELALQGNRIAAADFTAAPPPEPGLIRLYSTEDRFLGIFRLERPSENRLAVPIKVFS